MELTISVNSHIVACGTASLRSAIRMFRSTIAVLQFGNARSSSVNGMSNLATGVPGVP
ncbi:MAG: hypothetical protein LBM08_12435 [Dysgonamonadaceae bacterium]|nr:hypothetical protein [Dysgonamonadaceae bacterium]